MAEAVARGAFARWLVSLCLLAIVIIGLLQAGSVAYRRYLRQSSGDLVSALDLPAGDYQLVCFLQANWRCGNCAQMRMWTEETINGLQLGQSRKVRYQSIDFQEDRYTGLVERYRLKGLSHLLVARIRNGHPVDVKVLMEQVVQCQRDRNAFQKMLTTQLEELGGG